MQTIEFITLPRLTFAHVHNAEVYHAMFPAHGPTSMEITYIAEGSLHFRSEHEDTILHKGDVLCSNFSEPFSIDTDSFHEHHTVGIKIDWEGSANQTNGLLLPQVTKADLHTGKVCSIIDSIIEKRQLYAESSARGAAAFFELVCEIDQCNRHRGQKLPSEVMYTQRAKEYIHSNIYAPISQQEVAEVLSITPEYLCAVFKKTEGMPLIKYINFIKLQAIASLMERENIRLYEATAMYGYTDPNYVSRLYKKYFGHNITQRPQLALYPPRPPQK